MFEGDICLNVGQARAVLGGVSMVGLWKELGPHLLKSTHSMNSHKQTLSCTFPVKFQAESR